MVNYQNNMKKKQIKSTDQTTEQAKNPPKYTKRLQYRDLDPRWWRFVNGYLKHNFNATEAYKEAYPESSHDSAIASGSRLLENPLIKQAIEERIGELHIKELITLERILLRLDDRATDPATRASDRNQADMLLSKLQGYLNEEKIQVNVIGTDDLTEIRQRLSKKRSVNSISQEVTHNVQDPEKEAIKEIEAVDINQIEPTGNNKNTDNNNLT